MGAESGHMSLRKAGIPYRIKVSSCENWEVCTWKDVNLGEIFNGDVNLAAELFVKGPGRDLFGALIAAGAYSSKWASIDYLEEHIQRQHGPGAHKRWQAVNRLLDKLSCGAKDHGYGLFEEDAQSGSWRIAAQWDANVHSSKQGSLRTAAIKALAGPPCYCQVRCTLLSPFSCAYTEFGTMMLQSLYLEGPICSFGLSSDPEDKQGAGYHLLSTVSSCDAPLRRFGSTCRSWSED